MGGDAAYAYRFFCLAIGLALGVPSGQTCFTYNCGFEGPCQLENGYTGHPDIQWRVHQGGTPSSGTGPSSGYGGYGSYTYMEASDPVETGDTSWLSLPPAGNLGEVCVELAYHMRGQHIGRLELYTKEGSVAQSNVRWSVHGDQGPNWIAENITVLLPSNNSQITFRGVKGPGYQGDIALDSINVTCGRCGEVTVPTQTTVGTTEDAASNQSCNRYFCDFETACDATIGHSGQNPGTEWRRNNGSTPLDHTGPSSGYGGYGSYIYMETSGQNVSGSTWFSISGSGYAGLLCVRFAYHMYGEEMGRLQLLITEPSVGSWNPVWRMAGNQGNVWRTTSLTVAMPTPRARLTWLGIRGPGARSAIALDEILVECLPCDGSTTTPYTTLRPQFITSPTASTSSAYVTHDDVCKSYFCDFEGPCVTDTGFTGMNSAIEWRRHVGSTPSSSTGPSSGFGGSGYYMYMETSETPNVPGWTWLFIPASGYTGQVCVAFAYHMYGDQMGNLELYASDPVLGSGPSLWNVTGNQGNVWRTARVTVMMPSSLSRISWVGVKGSGFRSHIALDQISVQCGACGDITSSPYTTSRPHFTTSANNPEVTSKKTSLEFNVSLPDTHVVKRSDSVTVTCYLYVDTTWCGNVTFEWFFPSNTKIQEHHHGFDVQTFYSLQPSYFFSVLTVTSAHYWLSGVYTCRVSFDGNISSQRVVIVIYPQG